MVVPDDLQYYPLSGRFIKKSALQQRGFRITKKTAYKDYVAAFAMANTKNVKAYAGLDLMLLFSNKLLAMLEMHGGIKIKIVALPHSGVDTTLHRTTSKPSALRLDVNYWCCKESTSRLRSTSCFPLQPPSCLLSHPRLESASMSHRGRLELLVGWSYSPLTLTGICPHGGCSSWPSKLVIVFV